MLLTVILAVASFIWNTQKARTIKANAGQKLHSLPSFYGYYTALCCVIPSIALIFVWSIIEDYLITSIVVSHLPGNLTTGTEELSLIINDIKITASGAKGLSITSPLLAAAQEFSALRELSSQMLVVASLSASMLGITYGRTRINPNFRARNKVENAITNGLAACAFVAILTTVGIVLSVLLESIRFFQTIPITDFLFGLKWSPQIAMRADQAGSSGAFGAVPLITGTMLISAVAMIVAVPIGLLSAIYLSEYATDKFRSITKPLIEILAGIPTVVYGFFAALVIAPFIRDLGSKIGLDVSSESALAAGLVMGIMIIPFVSSLSDDFINAVPQSLRDGAYALGATQSETIRQVIIPAALPGIVGGILLAVSRAIGETMIVVMAAGLSANLTANPLEAVTTVTTQIVTLLVGDQEFDSPKTLAAFALGLVLFLLTLTLNIIALRIVRKYREQYE